LAGRSLLPIALVVAVAIVVVGACSPQVAPPPPATTAPPTATPTLTPTSTPTAARPSPPASPSPAPSPTPSPTGATGTPPPLACAAQGGGDPNAQAQLTAIRTAHQPGFDRVVFEFGPSSAPVGAYGMPLYEVSVVTQFIGGGSGRPVPVDGNAFLQVRFRNASTVDPTTGTQTFTQTDIHPGLPLVREVKLIDDFERVMTWGLGLERLACAKITELAGPVRLVVDLPTPP
jgi:hypothetical protein